MTTPDEVLAVMCASMAESDGLYFLRDDRAAVLYADKVKKALTAAEALGWRLVPVEATEEMHAAGYYVFSGSEYQEGNAGLDRLTTFQIYEAMLAAAPKVGEL